MVDTKDLKSFASACRFESGRGYQKGLHMKSSIEYTELFGLRIALNHAKSSSASVEVIRWIQSRIEYLEAK